MDLRARLCARRQLSPFISGMVTLWVSLSRSAPVKRDYVRVTLFLDEKTALGLIDGWFEDYNENPPHSGPKWRSPREFIAAQNATA